MNSRASSWKLVVSKSGQSVFEAAERHITVEKIEQALVTGQEMARTESVRVPAVPFGAHAGSEVRRRFHQGDIPSPLQGQLVCGCASGKTAADDQG